MKKIKYSPGFERDYSFYLNNIEVFTFCGTLNPKHEAFYDADGKSAKECFYYIESQGVNYGCIDPNLLNKILRTKASVNFMVKQWAEGRADGTLPLIELSKRLTKLRYPNYTWLDINTSKVIEWVNMEPIYHEDIETQYGLPEWVIEAVENQKIKLIAA